MATEAEIHNNKRTDKTYISPRVETVHGPLRIASKVLDSEGLCYAKVKKEVVLRRTPTARTEIVAKFLEDDRGLTVITLQAFNGTSGLPQQRHFSFVGEEIPKLLRFFEDIAAVELKDAERVNLTDEQLHRLVLSREQASKLVHDNSKLFADVARSDITTEDIIALGYRKKQLGVFKSLLEDRLYFDRAKASKAIAGDEALWQAYFEKNRWVFGYGLSYYFVTGFDDRKLEQAVQGHDLINQGKRVDGLMKTVGIVNSLCFVEIKTHETALLESAAYRSGCWAPSRELVGAVAQVQGTVASAMRNLYGLIRPATSDGTPTGEEVYNFRPRAFIVIGSLSEFVVGGEVNEQKFRSFEHYRNSIIGIDILTFDELYERSRFIVEAAISAESAKA